jgi:sugar phosphate isomerase/epimerase
MNMNEHSVTALGGTRFNLFLMRQTHRLVSHRKNLMNDATVIDAATLQAYRETEFRVDHEPPFMLRIDQRSDDLAAMYRQHGVRCSAYITAVNPLGLATEDRINVKRYGELAADIRGRGLTMIEGVGQHPSGDWPGEPSFLVLGLDLEAAKALGRKYEQNAIVWCGDDSNAQLVLLR